MPLSPADIRKERENTLFGQIARLPAGEQVRRLVLYFGRAAASWMRSDDAVKPPTEAELPKDTPQQEAE
jgi:hypothetical protein